MRVTHQQLVELVLPVLETVCERWQDRLIEAVLSGEGIELSGLGLEDGTCWAARCGHVECLRLLIAAGVSQAGIDGAVRRAGMYGQVECQKLLEAEKAKEE